MNTLQSEPGFESLNQKDFESLVGKSFQYSEGDENLQRDYFRYMHQFEPGLKVPTAELSQKFLTQIAQFVVMSGVHPEGEPVLPGSLSADELTSLTPIEITKGPFTNNQVFDTLQDAADTFAKILNGDEAELGSDSPEVILHRMTTLLIERDFEYMLRKYREASASKSLPEIERQKYSDFLAEAEQMPFVAKYSHRNDPLSSRTGHHINRYVLDGNYLGVSDKRFRRIFSDMAELIDKGPNDASDLQLSRRVFGYLAFLKSHPFLPETKSSVQVQ